MRVLTTGASTPIRTAVAVTARTVPPSVAVVAVAAAMPALVTWVRGGHDFDLALQAAALLVGAGAGFAADDQAANVLAPSPTPLLARRALRAVAVALVLAAGAGAALVAAAAGARPLALAGPSAVLAAATATAAALAAGVPTNGPSAPGVPSALATVLALATVTAFAERWSWVPSLARPGFDRRWLVVAAVGAAVAMGRSLDPARRRR